jgi:acetyltransferase-like isoleucine patch superfamily enzyme
MAQPRRGHLVAKARRVPSRLRRLPVSLGYFRGPILMSHLRKWWVLARNPHATIRFGRGSYVGPGFSLHMPWGGTFIAGEGTEFRRNFRAELGAPDSRIEIGAHTVCTYDVLMQCGTTIRVGEYCGLGQATIFVDGNHRFRDLSRPALQQGYDFKEILIADGATVMSKCTVIGDVGKRAMVGANSVVTRPIPAYCVAAGAPARPIDYFGPPGLEPAELSESNSERSG